MGCRCDVSAASCNCSPRCAQIAAGDVWRGIRCEGVCARAERSATGSRSCSPSVDATTAARRAALAATVKPGVRRGPKSDRKSPNSGAALEAKGYRPPLSDRITQPGLPPPRLPVPAKSRRSGRRTLGTPRIWRRASLFQRADVWLRDAAVSCNEHRGIQSCSMSGPLALNFFKI